MIFYLYRYKEWVVTIALMIQQKQVLKYTTLHNKIIQIYVTHLISYLTDIKMLYP